MFWISVNISGMAFGRYLWHCFHHMQVLLLRDLPQGIFLSPS